jgi:signal transduction histidine kinase
MTKKLLNKTERVYLMFFIVTFIVVAPLFYFITEKLYIDDADESLMLRKHLFLKKTLPHLKESDITTWNKFNFDIKILPDKGLKKDTLFFTSYYENLDKESEPYREINAPILIENKPYTFSARSNLLESDDLTLSIALLFIILILLLYVGFYVFNKKLSSRLWKPFYSTLQQIEKYEIDKNEVLQFEDSDIEEFVRLNNSLKKLIQKNALIYESQKEFVENAAHELQTPIAVFKAKIDTLMQSADLTKEQSEILTALNHSIARLKRLNKNLLLLSKIDKQQFKQTEAFSIKELITKLLIFFKEQAARQNIEINTDFQDDISLTANIGLTEILMNNLLLNAIKHNIKNGQITISISNGKLIIANTGISKELPKEKLFNRFSKENSSTSGNGLGLAIVKKIIDHNNWAITYSYADGIHNFIIQF